MKTMNKYQEALEYLTEEAYSNYFRKYVQTSKEKVFLFKSAKALQELVNKATPKEPVKKKFNEATMWDCADYFVERNACPTCKIKIINKSDFCPCCGQAIDWGTYK